MDRSQKMEKDWRAPVAMLIVLLGILLFGLGYFLSGEDAGEPARLAAAPSADR